MPDRRRPLWWALGALTSLVTAALAFSWWLSQRRTPPAAPASSASPTAHSGTPTPLPTGTKTTPGVIGQTPDTGGTGPISCGGSCGDSCDDSCNQVCGDIMEDIVEDTCQAIVDDSCAKGTLNCGDSNLSCGQSAQWVERVTSLWMSVADPRPLGRVTLPARAGLLAIRCYQRWVSPRLGAHCRYTPSCSRYGAEAIRVYGAWIGTRLALARIRRCTAEVPCGTPDPVLPTALTAS